MSQLIRYGAHVLAGFLPVPGSRTALSYRTTHVHGSPLDPDTTLFYDFAGTKDLIDEISGLALDFTRASSAWYYDAMGLLVEAANDAPRFDHNQGNKVSLGLLMEEARTNLCLWSRNGAQTAWDKTNMDAAQNQVGIDGVSNTATLLTANAANATILQTVTGAATNRAFSVSLKRVTGTGQIDISGDAFGGNLPITLTTEWERFFVTANIIDPVFGIRLGTSGDEVAMDVAQLEDGGFATSPIITAASTMTRAQEFAKLSNVSWFNNAEGTFFARLTMHGSALNSFTMQIDSGAPTDRYYLNMSGGINPRFESETSVGTDLRSTSAPSNPVGDPIKWAGVYSTGGGIASVHNGGVVNQGPTATIPLTNSAVRLELGNAANAPTVPATCRIAVFAYANVRKDDAFLQDVTMP